ncbi:MAG: glycosyltransferase [Desulfobacula sp.]|uniref:glycosyltransferase n=5 Tax=Desulfobacula sp. TaxID=2593537 RepID=UPI001DE84CED|nr:glycosyltransferase [Desulfobacula sp.]MBT3486005.1 glycosyltransferase [Desulfobacula sp.]MBT3804037.1 glycosyltransferase [Desulfobacula sp.]MBT5972850.1 glycosyltransferase [Desulfobacula sp.]MBT6750046.1 glycosyltransferase [Desulfobacula sp.]
MEKTRICILSHLYPVSQEDYKGIFVRDLAFSLVQKGFDVHVVTPLRPGAQKKEISNGIKIHRYAYYGWKKGQQLGQVKGLPILMLGSLISAGILSAVHLVIKKKIDLLHAYWIVPGGFMAAITGMLTCKPVVATAAGSDLNIAASNKIVAVFAWFTLKRISNLISVSRPLEKKALLLGIPQSKSMVIPGPVGIDMESYTSPACLNKRSSKNIQLLYTGNLESPKRVDTIIKAAGRLKEKGIKFHLTIAGEGPLQKDLEDLAISLGIKSLVKFKGRISHDKIPELMQEHHIFLHCSENEGLPVAIMEAMAAGLPVIAAKVGGVPELVKNGVTGYGLNFDDDKGFADKIMQLYQIDHTRIKMGHQARSLVDERFNKKKIINQNVKIYNSILKKG